MAIRSTHCLQRDLETSGSSNDMAVNGSSTPVEFSYTVEQDCVLYQHVGVMVQADPTPLRFAGLDTVSNGMLFDILDDNGNVAFDLTGGTPVVTNAMFALMAGVSGLHYQVGIGTDSFSVQQNFRKTIGDTLYLPKNWVFRATVRDNLTNVNEMRWSLQGQFIKAFGDG